ncbi:MAG: M28 family peptidase [Clostridia bacterium]|nr:M28 family peptidase [Clostridia bacterium]
MENNHIETLMSFLNVPLDCSDTVFDRFAALPGAVIGVGDKPLERYVYIPGKRNDRVVLVSHIDTIWDKAYTRSFSGEREVKFTDGVFSSSIPECGIGADDRAGCAMLWELRECGHSILIVDGEEHGKIGARYLKKSNPRLFRELNRHKYIIELDWAGTDSCLYNQVDNTKRFKKHIEKSIGFVDAKASGGTDLQILCRNICGVNLGIGYHGQHTKDESLVLSEWENTCNKLNEFLAEPQHRFRSYILPPYIRFAKLCINKLLRILKIKKDTVSSKGNTK